MKAGVPCPIWSVGVTTVPERRNDLLPKTLASLCKAGFGEIRLFVDGAKDGSGWQDQFKLPTTAHWPRLGAYGNWWLALVELWARSPKADRYALFQDDVEVSGGLRNYLTQLPMPIDGYWNLMTVPRCMGMAAGRKGWFHSPQRGYGACGLVFSNVVTLKLLSSDALAKHLTEEAGDRNIDGTVVNAANKLRIKEMVHNPSLIRHAGYVSSINREHTGYPEAVDWPGEGFDLTTLLPPQSKKS